MGRAAGQVREGGRPVLVEAATYRWHGHYEGDPERYREPKELDEWKQRDPLLLHHVRLVATGTRRDAIADLAAESVSAVAARSGLRTPPRHGSSC